MSRLSTPLSRELGARTGQSLEKHLGLVTVEDLLRHYPRKWPERGELTPLDQLVVGEQATVVAIVERASTRAMRNRAGELGEVVVTDGTTSLKLAFFLAHRGQSANLRRQLVPGARALFAGKVDVYQDALQLVQPQYELVEDAADEDDARAFAEQILPIYPATAKVTSWAISRAVRTVLDTITPDDLPDPLPDALRARRGLVDLHTAVVGMHRPSEREHVDRARARLRYEEAFVLQLALARRRARLAALTASAYPARGGGLREQLDASLPFALTGGQREVGEAISADLARPVPMNRLLQGEVGSGKTLVALRAMLQVVDAGAQAALLAPTEVLAAQHHRSLLAALGPLARTGAGGGGEGSGGTRVALLTGSLPAAARKAALLDAASGAAGIVVGTHALLQEAVEFADLGLVVVDEQHRFGVEQRDALRAKAGLPPHVLVMTATPIPRTVAMTVFGDLEVSTLTELPPGRSPVVSAVVPTQKPAYVARCWARVREEVLAGRQAYVVCPRIGGDLTDAEVLRSLDPDTPPERMVAAVDVLEQLRADPVTADLRLALLHGRLSPEDKDAVMRAFTDGEVDVLVATTVVEVGVDVPNATVMVVMDADRFGLSQLHQLRGRVGRGAHPGLCLLVSGTEDAARQQRLEEVAATSDGFAVADLDLTTRREGDVLGAAQSGTRSSLRLLKVTRDGALIATAREDATAVIDLDPELEVHPHLAAALAALDAEREQYLDRA